MKKYLVYLDESGDFDKDLTPGNWKTGSLVGGVFFIKEGVNLASLANKISTITGNENHATEVANDKGNLAYSLISGVCNSYPVYPVIFHNDIKRKIIDSTQTYLAVITEGLIQLLKTLVIQDNDSVELEVIAGFRKDTTGPIQSGLEEGYIGNDDYKKRIDEKLAIEKAKLRSEKLQKSRISVSLEDDKKNKILILADYICNFWYTKKTANAFKEKIPVNGNEVTIKTALMEYYKKEYVFSLFSSEEKEHIQRMIRDESYADALFEGCSGLLSPENYELLKTSLLSLKPKQIQNQLDNLVDYIGNLIAFYYYNDKVEGVLGRAEELSAYLESKGVNIKKFLLDIKLYKLAYLNHLGRFEEMATIFDEVEQEVAQHTTNNLDFEYLMIFYIRKAVYLFDLHRYKESIKICDDLELLIDMIGEAIKSNDCIELKGEIKSEQLGKVLGTKLQAQIYECVLGKRDYDTARDTSDRAIRNFVYPSDLKRQYQYRAELEAACGHLDEAISWMEKSFDGAKWETHLSSKEIYDLYNFLFIAAAVNEKAHDKSKEIAGKVEKLLKKDFENLNAIEIHCYIFLAYVYYSDEQYHEKGKRIAEKLIAVLSADKDCPEYRSCEAILNGENGFVKLYQGD